MNYTDINHLLIIPHKGAIVSFILDILDIPDILYTPNILDIPDILDILDIP